MKDVNNISLIRSKRCLKYFGDILQVRTVEEMNNKLQELYSRLKEKEDLSYNEDKWIKETTTRIL